MTRKEFWTEEGIACYNVDPSTLQFSFEVNQ
jgi:hypothetical protein